MKIAACVILYHPQQTVENNIQSYINKVEKLYVVDNSLSKIWGNNFLNAYQLKTIFIHDGINEGIAKRLNQACDLATKDGFEFLLTMDQDSSFDESLIKQYLSCISSFAERGSVSMFGINHENQLNNANSNYESVKHFITSGSIINLKNYKNIGGFNEDLFIDFVDTDFCFRSILKKYQLIKFPGIYMHHAIGTITMQRSVKNLKSTTRSIHSSVRLYYMVRNFFYLKNKYKNVFTHELAIIRIDLFHRIKNKLLYNNKRLRTIQVIIKAVKDFRSGKMGKQF